MQNDVSETEVTSRDVAKGAGTTLLARLGSIFEVIVQPIYVWMFGLATFGLYSVLWSAINLIENVADLGMTSALQRTVPQSKTRQKEAAALRAALILGVGPCIPIAILVSVFAPSLTHIFNASASDTLALTTAIRVFIWALPLWAFVEIATSALRAQRAFGPEIRLRILWEQVARFVIAGALWLAGFSTLALLYAHLASLVIICGLSVRLLAKHFDLRSMLKGPLIDDVWASTAKAGFAVLPHNVVARMFGDAPQLILNAMIPGANGAVVAGLYVIARKISSLVQIVQIAFSYVMAPLASLASTGRRESVLDIYGFATRVSIAIVLPLGVTLAAGARAILDMFGAGAEAALPAVAMLIIARIVEAALGNAIPIQQVIGGYRGQLVGSIAGLLVAVGLGAFLMPEGGLTGITIAVTAGLIIAAIIPFWQVHRYEGLHPFAQPFGRVLFRSTLISAVCMALAFATQVLTKPLQLPTLALLLLTALWCSARFALPRTDREHLGATGKKLRLV